MAVPIAGPRDLPQVSPGVEQAVREPLTRVIEELQRLLGFRGDAADQAITFRKAVAAGIVDSLGNALGGGGTTVINNFPSGGGGGGGSTAPDLTPPPTPTGLLVQAGFTQVLVFWDPPTYTMGHGHKQTNIYGVKKDPADPTLPTFGTTTPRVATAVGPLTIMSVPSELNTRWHIWIKWETVDGVESVTAAGGVHGYELSPGVYPTTGQDIAQLIEVLTGYITAGMLDTALRQQINLITAADDVAGSVNARIKAETDARVAEIDAEVLARIGADQATLLSAKTYTNNFTYSQQQIDANIAASGTVLATSFATLNGQTLTQANSYTINYAYSRSEANQAIAANNNVLVTSFTQADAANLNQAKTFTQQYAYSQSQVDGALASLATTLRAEFNSSSSGVTMAQLTNYAYSKAAVDGAFTANTTTLQAFATSISGSSRGAMNADPNCINPLAWDFVNGPFISNTAAAGAVGSQAIYFPAGTLYGQAYGRDAIPVDPARRYSYTARFFRAAGFNRHKVYLLLRFYRADGSYINSDGDGWSSADTSFMYGAQPPNEGIFALVGADFGLNTPRPIPAGTAYLKYMVFGQWDDGQGWGNGTVNHAVQDIRITDVTEARAAGDQAAQVQVAAQNYTNNYAFAKTSGEALAGSVQLLSATVGGVQGGLANLQTVVANQGFTTSQQISQLYSKIDSPNSSNNATYAALQQEAQTRAELDGAVSALYTVRAEVSSGGRTVVGGFGLAATATKGAGPRIDFGVRADTFYVAAPAGAGVPDAFPFIIRTSPIVENGVAIPAGVYMDSAYIVNLSAMYARIANLVADSISTAKLNAAQLQLGSGEVGGNLRSTTFNFGNGGLAGTGWLLQPNGTVFLNNAVVYGGIYAAYGVFAGSLSAADGTFRGTLQAASGSFSGNLSGSNITGAFGTFSGSLNVKSAAAGARTEITDSVIRVYDAAGVLRVKLGNLA